MAGWGGGWVRAAVKLSQQAQQLAALVQLVQVQPLLQVCWLHLQARNQNMLCSIKTSLVGKDVRPCFMVSSLKPFVSMQLNHGWCREPEATTPPSQMLL